VAFDYAYLNLQPRGGGTYIAEDSVGVISRWLRDHPNGVQIEEGTGQDTFDFAARLNECKIFTEMTGGESPTLGLLNPHSSPMIVNIERGDVIILHPLMMHSASKNHTRAMRLITNPPVALKEPFNFNRSNPADFSLVERKTLKDLGVDRLDFTPGAPRKTIVPTRIDSETVVLAEELERK
jgi:hypothetical protein